MASMPRAALGSCASLGDLYDARRDDFCGFSIFKKKIPEAALTLRDAAHSDVKLVHGDNYSDKFKELDVCAELQVSVLGGLFKLKGSGQYLYDQKMSARTVKSSLIYNTKTKEESVNIFHEDVKEAFAIDAIQTGAATHVVVGISWGANCILTCQFENKENSDVTKISGELSAHMSKLSRSISGSSDADFREGDTSTGMKLDVRMFGDVVANGELPTTAEAALQLMKNMPELVKSYNGGKGSPLSYTLLPITTLTPYLNLSIKTDIIIKSLEESSIMQIVQFLDQMSNAKQEMHDFQRDAAEFNFCITVQDYKVIKQLDGVIAIEESKMRSQLAKVLTDVRSGKCDVTEIQNLLVDFQKSEMSPHNVATILSEWSGLLTKINFARTLIHEGVTYIGRGASLEDKLLEVDSRHQVFVLYFSKSSGTEHPDRWRKNKQLLINHVKRRQDGNKYFVVDCDIHPDAKKGDKTSVVQVLKEGELDCEDLLEQEQFLKSTPLVKATSSVERTIAKPDKRVRLAIACPGDTCSPSVVYEWFCFKCTKEVEYGFDQFIYCACGKTPTSSLQFRCKDPKHGVFMNDTAYLGLLLSTLRLPEEEQKLAHDSKSNQGNFPLRADDSPKEVNILLLGENGVGKSTWINGFANLIRYKTLDEAERGELHTAIPTRFTVMNENYEMVAVSAGEYDESERQEAGVSCTRSSKVYPFMVGNTVVRLIDTPGIGGTGGINPDQENFEKTLKTLSDFNELHGICILLKPNSARLSVTFRYCIKELLTYFHKDASKNIVFCFTNSRGSFYRPGDTMPALRKLLSEYRNVNLPISKKTLYCFDSEFYRFLAAIKNKLPVSFTDVDRENISFSWQKSMNETKRLLEYIETLTPHKTNNTLNLNFARKLVVKLSRPLSEITAKIRLNKTVLLEKIEELNECMQLSEREYVYAQKKIIQRLETEVIIYVSELKEIEKASIRFAYFLKTNAITPYNDAMEQYLQYLIEEEEGKLSRLKNRTPARLQGLEGSLRSYREQRGILEQEMHKEAIMHLERLPTEEDLKLMIDELQKLKYSGKALKDVLDAVQFPKMSSTTK